MMSCCRGTHRALDIRCKAYGPVLALILSFGTSGPVCGQGVRGALDDLVRGTAKVADDVPLQKVDDLVAEMSKSRSARNAVDAELIKAGRIPTGISRSEEVLKLLRSATSGLDPSVMRRLDQLDDGGREAALVLARGGEELGRVVPDITARSRLLREGGAETIAAVGMFGPDAARSALRLDEAIRGGSVVIKEGHRAVTLADFGSAMTRYGDASWTFWKEYVQPHWKVWTATGALAAYLANPEYFQDAAGGLTEAGFRHLTELAGELAASAIRGVGTGAGQATKEVADAVRDTYFSFDKGIYAAVGTLFVLLCISLLFRRMRKWVLWPFQWLNDTSDRSSESKV